MTCKEVLDLVSPCVDGELDPQTLSVVREHIDECRPCRQEYDLERMTKNLIQRSVAPARAPATLAAAIRQSLAADAEAEASRQVVFRGAPRRRFGRAVAAFGLIAAGVVLLMLIPTRTYRSHAQPVDANIVHQTYNNFDRVLNSSFDADVNSHDPVMLSSTLSKCPCKLHLPALKDCRFVEGRHSFYKNDHIAEFVFLRNNNPVYVYETKLLDVVHGGNPRLDSNVMRVLRQTGWYAESNQPDCSMILRLQDSTIYCTVADMNKEQLFTLLR